jgi:hypothetical protein
MMLRRDSSLVAAVLFTIALLWLIPWFSRDALTTISPRTTETGDVWQYTALQYNSYFGQSSLLIILIGVTVTWFGYVNRSRWMWLVQFMIAIWAFRLFVLPIAGPILRGHMELSVAEWAYSALHQDGLSRIYAESFLILFLMVLALLLPIRSLVRPQPQIATAKRPNRRIVYAAGALVAITACLLWINFREYQITPAALKAAHDI